MPSLLRIDASIDEHGSRSRAITTAFADAWAQRGPEFTTTALDLHREPVPHLSDPALHWAPSLRQPGAAPSPEAEAVQQRILAQLFAADVLLLGAPMYNYSLPSTLKAWLDHVHVPGTTTPFGDLDTRPLAGRDAVVVSSRGGSYDPGSPTEGWDHAVPPLQIVLGEALGMRVHVITTSLTLAGSIPAMAEHAARADEEFAQATAAAVELARTLPA